MNIKNIEEAKKYLGKKVYTAHNFNAKRSNAKNKVAPLYIGGVHLFYNQVDYDVIALHLYEDEKCRKGWGKIELKRIKQTFDPARDQWESYFFSMVEAEKYCEWLNRDEKEKNRERDIENAKELLDEHGVKYEIFL